MDFKYKSKFNVLANIGTKPSFAKNELVAKASLSDLRALLPSNEEIEDNPDLLYTAFNVCVANLINANDDGIMTPQALAMAPYFIHKQGNLEHMRSYIVGHAINYGFSSFADSSPLTAAELTDSTSPFNISLAAVVYRVVDEYFADYLSDASDASHYLYNNVATSWEIGFNEYVICLGSKQISEAEMITKDEQVKEFSKYLRCEGGTGFTKDGVPVSRIIVGSPRPLGFGFTSSPAAAVEGVYVAKPEKEEDNKSNIAVEPPIVIASTIDPPQTVEGEKEGEKEEISDKNEKNNKKSSQATKNTVNKNNMKITNLDELYDNWAEVQASDARTFIREQLKEMNDKFSTEKTAKDDEIKAAKEELETAVKNASAATAELEKVKAEIVKIKADQEAQAFEIAFNERMASLDEAFELSDKQRAIIAKQVKQIGTDKEFSEWLEDFKTINEANVKTEKEVEVKEVVATDALDKVDTKVKSDLPNSGAADENKIDKYRAAFAGDGVVISKRR